MTSTAPSTSPIVALEGVHAVDACGPSGGALGRLLGVDWRAAAGLHAIVGGPADGTAALAGVLAGAYRPRAGVAAVDGRPPWRDAAVRRSIAALLPSPALAGRTVAEAMSLAAELRGAPSRVEVLDELGLAGWASRRVSSLTYAESRAVDLALVLAHPTPRLVVVYEPFSLVAGADGGAVRRALLELSTRAAVVVLTSTLTDVAGLAERVVLLEAGRLALHDGGDGWELRAATGLALWLADPDGRATGPLVRALAERLPDALALGWERGGPDGLTVIRLRARDLDAAARAVVDVTCELDVDVRAIESPPEEPAALLARAASRPRGEAR